ncbi:2,3-dihydroxybenzoate-AMP ligase [Microbacterium sp. Root61]|nr:2,3-dihydroxybenzoate-AMP ligase [Microbacterium sp. Root61]
MERRDRLHPDARVSEYTDKGWWTAETIDGIFRGQVAERADKLAIVDPANRVDLDGNEPRRLTWGELGSEVTALAARLLEHGVGRGDLIGAQLLNSIELAELYLAAWTIGAAVSPLAMQYRENEIGQMSRGAAFDVVVAARRFADRAPAEDIARLTRGTTVRTVFCFDTGDQPLGEDVIDLTPAAATAADAAAVEAYRAAHPNDPNDCVTICWTSGTEGLPKGVMRAHYDWLAFSWATLDAPRVIAEDVLLNPFPMINMAGICGMMLPWLRSGAALVQHHPFDAPTFFRQIAVERVTYTLAPPAMLWMLLNNEELLSRIDLSSLTRIGSGSAPLQPAMVRGWQERFGLSVINFFGSNEGVALLSSSEDFPDPDERALFFPRYGAEGAHWSSRVGDWIKVKLVDLETGEVITEHGRAGELHIAGPHVFPGYADMANLNTPFDEEGYLKTGDMFEIAGQTGQFLRYVDRAKDIIIRGGMNVAPAELEAHISDHPDVMDVAVVGYPDDALGERIAVIVVPRPDTAPTLESIVELLRGHQLASFKLPERLEVRDVLPRNPVGKVLKRDLRESLTAPVA